MNNEWPCTMPCIMLCVLVGVSCLQVCSVPPSMHGPTAFCLPPTHLPLLLSYSLQILLPVSFCLWWKMESGEETVKRSSNRRKRGKCHVLVNEEVVRGKWKCYMYYVPSCSGWMLTFYREKRREGEERKLRCARMLRTTFFLILLISPLPLITYLPPIPMSMGSVCGSQGLMAWTDVVRKENDREMVINNQSNHRKKRKEKKKKANNILCNILL